jgi:phosphate transport system permease protein
MTIRSSAPPNYGRSKLVDRVMRGLLVLATLAAIVPLALIVGYVLVVGGGALNQQFFTQAYAPPLVLGSGLDLSVPDVSTPQDAGNASEQATADPFANIDVGAVTGADSAPVADATPGAEATADPFANIDVGAAAGAGEQAGGSEVIAQGGVLHGIVGTLLVAGAALLLAIPIGLLAGIFLAEYPANPVAIVVRFCSDVLSGAPSIIVGVTAYVLLVRQFQTFSGLAGSVALALLMVPTITRTTEEILKLVPESIREAAQAMGAPTWYATFTVIVPTVLSGITTGVMLAVARGAGETAPLLLTLMGNNELTFNLLGPIAALPLLTYRYTESPFPSENNLAWGTAFVLMMMVLLINILVRLATRSRLQGR